MKVVILNYKFNVRFTFGLTLRVIIQIKPITKSAKHSAIRIK